jgi:acyl-CoA synthetase (AMP-forming)/AMP-acid ligase II
MTSLLWARLAANAAALPDKAAFIYPEKGIWKTVTYAGLLDSADRFARGLEACRVEPGMRAALMTPPSADFFALAFALLKTGVVPIIVDPAIGLKKAGECLHESRPDIFIGNGFTHVLRRIFGWGRDSLHYNLTLEKIRRRGSEGNGRFYSIADDAPAAIVYTSGSTGLPKGAIYSQGNFAAQLDMLRQTFDIRPDEIDLPAFPLYAIIDALLGVTSVIPDIHFPVPGRTNPEKVFAAIGQFKVTNMFASPVVLDILGRYGESKNVQLGSLKRVITAGAPAPFRVQEKFKRLLPEDGRLYGIYGATEGLPIAMIDNNEESHEVREKSARGAGVCLGKPAAGMRVRVIRITDEPIAIWEESLQVGLNTVGEITVQGAAVTRGYVAREDVNRLAKIRNGEEVIHRMGDVGYFDERGRLWYCGRKSQRVETRDSTFFTEQIEGVFNAHHHVYRTALVSVNGEPVLWIELEKEFTNKEQVHCDLAGLAREHPQASQIKTFLFKKRFPTDVRHNSKIIREELTALAVRRLRSPR